MFCLTKEEIQNRQDKLILEELSYDSGPLKGWSKIPLAYVEQKVDSNPIERIPLFTQPMLESLISLYDKELCKNGFIQFTACLKGEQVNGYLYISPNIRQYPTVNSDRISLAYEAKLIF